MRRSIRTLARTGTVQSVETPDESTDRIHVVIPACDGSPVAAELIEALPDRVHGHPVKPIIVTNRQSPRLPESALQEPLVVEHPCPAGRADAILTGLDVADRLGTTAAVTMAPDGRHPTSRIPALVRPILENEADLVIGSRLDGRSELGVLRRGGIRLLGILTGVLAKADVTDPASEFRAIRGPELGRLDLSAASCGAPEFVVEARKKRLRTMEVPAHGQPIADRSSVRVAAGLLRTTLGAWLR
jgi:hypothetical protein